jgi:hypothetical protein
MALVYWINLRWEKVEGATGYEIRKDGVKVATAGQNARTTRVSVDADTLVEVVALPAREVVQTVEFSQEEVS